MDAGSLRIHGGRIDAAELLFPDAPRPFLDLSTGINPIGYPVPDFAPRLWQRLPLPSEQVALLVAARAAYGCPDTAHLVAGPGSELLIRLLPGLIAARQIAVLTPIYRSHPEGWRAAGAQVRAIEALQQVQTGECLILGNPNNPDGQSHAPAMLADLARQIGKTGGWLIVDEAFADLTPAGSLFTLPDWPDNLIVLRSLGKFYGLAGARVGFAAVPEALAKPLAERLGDWPISGPALHLARQALGDDEWARTTRARLAADRVRLDGLLTQAGLQVLGGTDLFRYVAGPEGLETRLAQAGVLIRAFDDAPGRFRFGLPDPTGWDRLEQALLAL